MSWLWYRLLQLRHKFQVWLLKIKQSWGEKILDSSKKYGLWILTLCVRCTVGPSVLYWWYSLGTNSEFIFTWKWSSTRIKIFWISKWTFRFGHAEIVSRSLDFPSPLPVPCTEITIKSYSKLNFNIQQKVAKSYPV